MNDNKEFWNEELENEYYAWHQKHRGQYAYPILKFISELKSKELSDKDYEIVSMLYGEISTDTVNFDFYLNNGGKIHSVKRLV